MLLRRFKVINAKSPMRRRLKFTTLIMINQLLLIGLAIAWLIHMSLIAANGAVLFEERNTLILWGEISTMVIITIFAIYVLAIQIQRSGERRRDSDKHLEDRG